MSARTVGDIIEEMPPVGNMRIWDAVAKTDPSHTKKVNQRGGFTAISAHYQIMQATKQFGPIGIGWGYVNGDPIVMADKLVVVPVTIWHGTRETTFGPLYGSAELIDKNGRIDSDAPKKASTDGLTKGLSQLGFNADVFLGKFDDNKYVQAMEREFAPQEAPQQAAQTREKPAQLQGPIKTRAALRTACGAFVRELHACEDADTLDAFLALPDSAALIEQVKAEHPYFWEGDGGDFLGLAKEIDQRRGLVEMEP